MGVERSLEKISRRDAVADPETSRSKTYPNPTRLLIIHPISVEQKYSLAPQASSA